MLGRYAVCLDISDSPIAVARGVEEFFVGDYSFDDFGVFASESLPLAAFRLTGVELLLAIDEYVGKSGCYEFGDVDIVLLDWESTPMGRYSFWGATANVDASTNSWAVSASTQLLPHAGAATVWERWRDSNLVEKGEWERLEVGLREGWVEASMLRHAELSDNQRDAMVAGDVILEGGQIFDLASFFCAIGEAFRGPGGYFGNGFTSMEECLEDAVGKTSVRLHWHDISVARTRLVGLVDPDSMVTQFDLLLKIMSSRNVEILTG